MLPNGREDIEGRGATLVVKLRKSGEITVSARLRSALGLSTAVVNLTSATDKPDWQREFHCHHFQVEIYLVVVGKIIAIWQDPDGIRVIHQVYSAGQSFSFLPGIFHDILTMPGSEHVTVKVPIKPGVDVLADRTTHVPDMPVEVKMAELLELAQKGEI